MVGIIHAYKLTEAGVVSVYGIAAAPRFGFMYFTTAGMLVMAHIASVAGGEEESGYFELLCKRIPKWVYNCLQNQYIQKRRGSAAGSVYSFTGSFEDSAYGGSLGASREANSRLLPYMDIYHEVLGVVGSFERGGWVTRHGAGMASTDTPPPGCWYPVASPQS